MTNPITSRTAVPLTAIRTMLMSAFNRDVASKRSPDEEERNPETSVADAPHLTESVPLGGDHTARGIEHLPRISRIAIRATRCLGTAGPATIAAVGMSNAGSSRSRHIIFRPVPPVGSPSFSARLDRLWGKAFRFSSAAAAWYDYLK